MDMSVVAFEECNFEVLGTAGDINLGGDDFDNRLVGHCVDEFKKAHGKDLRTDSRAMPRLRKACERAKRALSLSKETIIELEALHDGINFLQAITRTQFETNIHDVVHVGGSTRIPRVKKLLTEFFDKKLLSRVVEEAAVIGAAHLAATLCHDPSPKLDNYLLLDVAPLSLGVEVGNLTTTVMIPRSTTVPTKKTETFSTSEDNQSIIRIRVFEGEGWKIGCNPILHEFDFDGIPPMPRGEAKVDITFDTLEQKAEETLQWLDADEAAESEDLHLKQSEVEAVAATLRSFKLSTVEDAAKRHAEMFSEFPEPEVKKVSRLEREKKELANRSLVYGEIPFETVDAIFQLVRRLEGTQLRGNWGRRGLTGCGCVLPDEDAVRRAAGQRRELLRHRLGLWQSGDGGGAAARLLQVLRHRGAGWAACGGAQGAGSVAIPDAGLVAGDQGRYGCGLCKG
ncbi:hypothetical protein ON010_g17241 [Phytophthora cinnamomi]|nr:hypothetical protein ON010_g17241 [Phytophthora cinnamomi]